MNGTEMERTRENFQEGGKITWEDQIESFLNLFHIFIRAHRQHLDRMPGWQDLHLIKNIFFQVSFKGSTAQERLCQVKESSYFATTQPHSYLLLVHL